MRDFDLFSVIAPYLSNPLVLAGFVLLLAFVVHRALLSSRVLSKLSAQQSSLIVRTLLRYGFLIALAVLALGFGYVFFTTYLSRVTQERAELSLVDLIVEEDLTFDFKLENSGTDTAFLGDVKFVFYPSSGVLSICMPVRHTPYAFPFTVQLGDQLVQVADGISFPDEAPALTQATVLDHEKRSARRQSTRPYLVTQPLEISHAVPPGAVDRFKVRFVVDPSYPVFAADDPCRRAELYEAVAIITYDGSKTLTSEKFQVGYEPTRHAGAITEEH